MDKVLFVDEKNELLSTFGEALKNYRKQFEIYSASNEKEAVRLFKKHRIAVLAIDLQMREGKGLELLSYFIREYPWTPCIIITENKGAELEEIIMEDDTIQLITKPVDIHKLGTAIIKALESLDEGVTLNGVSPHCFLSIIENENRTCLLLANQNSDKRGIIYFRDGVLYDAICGDVKGEKAALEIMGWRRVSFRFIAPPDKKIGKRIDPGLHDLIKKSAPN